MSDWSLKACRERDGAKWLAAVPPTGAREDRRRLLALLDRLRSYSHHQPGCSLELGCFIPPGQEPCDCGFDELLRELDGGAK